MVPIAIPSGTRRDDPEFQALLAGIASGDQTSAVAMHELFMRPIIDDEVKEYLRESKAGKPDPRENLYTHVEEKIKALAEQMPRQALGTMQGVPAYGGWQRWINTIQCSAELLWRDFFAGYATEQEARRVLQPPQERQDTEQSGEEGLESPREYADALLERLEQLTVVAHLLMLFGLETALYQFRASVNARVGAMGQMRKPLRHHRPRRVAGRGGDAPDRGRKSPPEKKEDTIRGRITYLVKTYQRTLASWDDELLRITGRRFFRDQLGDAQRFKSMSKRFGPTGLDPREQGWAAYATDAQNELRYRFLDARRSEQASSGRRLAASWSRVQKWTTGYGTKPIRFVRTALIIILSFGLLFFANDYFNPGVRANARFCPAVSFSQTPPWEIAVHYLYIAVSNLTSLGSNAMLAQYCGGMMTELLLVASSLTGYFLLATLAALFFQQIREAES